MGVRLASLDTLSDAGQVVTQRVRKAAELRPEKA